MAAMAHTEVEDRVAMTLRKKTRDQKPKLIKTTGVPRVSEVLSKTDRAPTAMDQSTMMAAKAFP